MIFIPSIDKNMLRQGFSVAELVIVVALSSVILLAASQIMTRTTVTFKKGSDMLNTQMILDTIVERIRSDIRSLKELTASEPDNISFNAIQRDGEKTITYKFLAQEKTLFREERASSGKEKITKFGAAGKVEKLVFIWVPEEPLPNGKKEDAYLRLIIQIISNEPGQGNETKLPFVCNFHSKCQTKTNLPFIPKHLAKN